MADISDVEQALVTTIAGLLYPNGTSQPSAITAPCKIYRGWPVSDQLDADLVAGTVNVSVYPTAVERRTTKYYQRPFVPTPAAATLTATVSASASSVTIGGAVAIPQNIAIIVAGVGISYAVQANDTTTTIATGLATLLTNAGITASSSGAVITISGAPSTQITARVGVFSTTVTEVRRQKRNIMVTLWCPTPALRDAAAKIIDPAMALIDWLSLPDGSAGRLLYEHSTITDGLQKSILYRRDLVYSAEYGTTQIAAVPQVLINRTTYTGGKDPSNPVILQKDS